MALPVWGEEFLPPELAFKASVQAIDGRTLEVRFAIADNYYLYRDKFRFAVSPATVTLGAADLPSGKQKQDETFGAVEVYYRQALIRLPVTARDDMAAVPLTLQVTSQGCAEAGICYPPQQQQLAVTLPANDAGAMSSAPPSPTVVNDASGRIATLFRTGDFWLLVASFFGFGVLLSLTPCVFPMIPILSAIIVGAGGRRGGISHARGLTLSLGYVLGMAITYALVGVAAGLTGTLLTTVLQNPWVLGGFALLFVLLALSMFGFFELQLPAFLQSRLSERAAHLPGGSLPGVVTMGALSAVIVGPCVAAPLAGALLYIGQSGDAWLGGATLFAMALGMGMPLLAVGASAGTLLPKSGPWMEAVKKFFGVVLLATAVWLVGPVIPMALQMFAWALLLIIPAIYLHALDPLPPQAHAWQRFWKGIGVVMLLSGAALLVGLLAGSRDPLQPLAGLRAGAAVGESSGLAFVRVKSLDELEQRIAAAKQPVMLDFYADWCVSCKEMERFTFADSRVRARLAGWTLLQADVTANSPEDRRLLQRFQLYGPPGIIFFDRQGKEIPGVRAIGFLNADEFLALLSSLS
ncbi:MAG TPA: protein-disulfide reductase DsbD [Accumulibacter sp.]|nr:protein-disulfide reductase DsbD [Accumulibacter sp.]HNG38242.1 protein-disulfide reductase DsbD [Accumulibacter sp.]HNI72861.1 protein-disulfide reductase DsbD [Accumulibacter sp.]HNL76089.1 protein-disulfide reductase DsbD [Accumulibacter sp.]HNM74016.1 protein-disulfide reductase DsbD [Accumulibacter sp.]